MLQQHVWKMRGSDEIFRRTFFIVMVVKCWNKLSRDDVESVSLEVFKTQLDVALSSVI